MPGTEIVKREDAGEDRKVHSSFPAPQGPFVFSRNEEDEKAIRRLIDMEKDLSDLIKGRRAWGVVAETLRKIAVWLSAVAAGFLVFREVLRGLVG